MRRRHPHPSVLGLSLFVAAGLAGQQPARPASPTTANGAAPAPTLLPHELRSWSMRDGLPQSIVADVVQAQDGCLWLATFGGLVRFDGTVMTLFDQASHPGLRSSRIVCLCAARDGRIWIGTEDQGLICYRDGAFTCDGPASHVPHRTIRRLVEDTAGRLIGATDDGVWWIDGERFGRVPELHDLAHDVVELGPAHYWIATKHGLLQWRDDVLTKLADGDLRALHRAADGTIWCGSAAGALTQRTADGRRLSQRSFAAAVEAIGEDANGAIWVAPLEPVRLGNTDDARVALSRDAAPIHARRLLFDREGSLWFAGDGLWRARPTPFSGLTLPPGTDLPRSICADRQDRLWLVLYDDSLLLRSGDAFVRVGAQAGVRAQSIAPSRDGSLWVTSSHGLWRIDDGGARIDAIPRTLPPGLRRALLETVDGDLFVGCGAALVRLPAGSCRADIERPVPAGDILGFDEGLPGGEILALHESPPGTLWIGTVEGLARLEGRKVTYTYRRGKKLPGGEVRAIADAADGGLWIGTYGGGLCHIARDGSTRKIDAAQGLIENVVSRIASDGHGNLLLHGNCGLSVVVEADLLDLAHGDRDLVHTRLFRDGPGIRSSEATGGHMPITARTSDGALWFPGVQGALRYDPNLLTPLPPPAQVRIESAVVDGRDLLRAGDAPTQHLVAGPGPRAIEVRFAATTFVQPDQVRFRYRLRGFQDEWVDAGDRRMAIFTRVPPGDYQFDVQAANRGGEWRDAASALHFDLLPYAHETTWFKAAISTVGGLLMLLAFQSRTRQIRRRARALEAEVEARTAELRAAHDHLEEKVSQRTRELGLAVETMRANMTRRELLEGQLRESQKFEAVGRLAGGLAHDFNNMLTAVIGEADHAAALIDADSPAQSSLAQIVDSSLRAAGLTRQLLAYSCQQMLEPEDVQPDPAIRNLRGMLRRLVREGVDLQFELDAADAFLRVDPSQLEQVLINLVVNADDATPAGGSILVSTAIVEVPAAATPTTDGGEGRGGRHVVLRVRDTGAGIDEQSRGQIFDPFFSTKGPGKGAGLGLASVHGIVRQSGGHIRLDSEPGKGSTFHVYLPAVTPPQRAGSPAPRPHGRSRGAATILLCDDNPEVLRVAQRALEASGHTVLAATSPLAALQLARAQALDLIVTDLVMPEMSGRELAHQLRADHPDAPVLFLSGYSAEAVAANDGPGAGDLLPKPFTAQTLTQRVADLLAVRPG